MTDKLDWFPAELQPYLSPEAPENLHDISSTFIFMSADQLKSELKDVGEAIRTGSPPGPARKLPEESALSLAAWFGERAPFPQPPSVSELRARLAPEENHQTMESVRGQLDLVHRALTHNTKIQSPNYARTDAFAVPPQWQRRWELHLSGVVLPAWVGLFVIDQLAK